MSGLSQSGRLLGRLALVTGGGSGIGQAICKAFAKEGAKVAAVDMNEQGLKETLKLIGGDHQSFVKDISKAGDVSSLMTEVRSHFADTPSIAVNCAGITRDSFLLQMDERSFDDVINVNLKGTFLVTQAVAKKMIEAEIKNGSIINFSSIAAKIGNLGQANYVASKAGVVGLTKTAAKELAKFGIRCNAVVPGFIETPMTAAVPDKVQAMITYMTPLGRAGQPDEIAHTCVFLASEESSYVTGTCIDVTGGFGL